MSEMPPPMVRAYASAYRCTDCDSETKVMTDTEHPGIWRISVFHDAGCPVLAGHVSPAGAGLKAAAQTPGALYVGPVKS